MLFKKRSDFLSQADWLYYLFNDLGCDELALQMGGTLPNKDVWFSKRYKFKDLTRLEPKQYIPLGNSRKSKKITAVNFLNKATHRTILDIEILFDIDDEPIIETTKKIMLKYKNNNPVCYFTGSKSYHVHIFDHRLRNHPLKNNKTYILIGRKADAGKGSEKQLIAIEGAKHYRSGKIKQEVLKLD